MFLWPWDCPRKNPGVSGMPSSGYFPDTGIKPASPAFQADSLPLSHWRLIYLCSIFKVTQKMSEFETKFRPQGLKSTCSDSMHVHLPQASSQSVQSLIHVWLFMIPWTTACQASLSITNSQSLLKLMSIDSVMPSNHLILCHPLLLLPSIFPSIRVFFSESVLHIRWPKC